MRFLFYFVFFGLLFYVIWMYFPEAFQTLVSWAAKIYNFLFNVITAIVDHINNWAGTPSHLPEVPKVG